VAVGFESGLAVGSHLAVHRGFHPIRGGLFWDGVRTEPRQHVVRDIVVGFVTAMTASVGNGQRHRHPSLLTAVVACQALFWHGVRTEQRQHVVRDVFVGFVTAMTVSVGNGRRHRHPRLSAAPSNLVEVFHPECAFGAQPT
jgi:hypothetical protein